MFARPFALCSADLQVGIFLVIELRKVGSYKRRDYGSNRA